jgi:hypothetical protein
MSRQQLMTLVNSPTRLGSLSTSDNQGNINAAVVGSARMVEESTLILGLGDNRTLHNLRSHSKAVYLAFEPATSLLEWRGARLYLEVVAIDEDGPHLEQIICDVRANAGEIAARTIRAAVLFRITEIRPLIDRRK